MLSPFLLPALVAQAPLAQSPVAPVVKTHEVPKDFQLEGGATARQFSPDGRYLAMGNAAGKLVVWDWSRRKPMAVLQEEGTRIRNPLNLFKRHDTSLYNTEAWIAAIQFSPKARYLAAPRTTWKGLPTGLWAIPSGRRIDLEPPDGPIAMAQGWLAFSPDEKFFFLVPATANLATSKASLRRLPGVLVWETDSGRLRKDLSRRLQSAWDAVDPMIRPLGFLEDGRFLVHARGAFRTYDLLSGQAVVQPVALPGPDPSAIQAFIPKVSGRTLLLTSMGQPGVVYWDPDTRPEPLVSEVSPFQVGDQVPQRNPFIGSNAAWVLPDHRGAVVVVTTPLASLPQPWNLQAAWIDPATGTPTPLPAPWLPDEVQPVLWLSSKHAFGWTKIHEGGRAASLLFWSSAGEAPMTVPLPGGYRFCATTPEGQLLGEGTHRLCEVSF